MRKINSYFCVWFLNILIICYSISVYIQRRKNMIVYDFMCICMPVFLRTILVDAVMSIVAASELLHSCPNWLTSILSTNHSYINIAHPTWHWGWLKVIYGLPGTGLTCDPREKYLHILGLACDPLVMFPFIFYLRITFFYYCNYLFYSKWAWLAPLE